jgi:hypothetical protein
MRSVIGRLHFGVSFCNGRTFKTVLQTLQLVARRMRSAEQFARKSAICHDAAVQARGDCLVRSRPLPKRQGSCCARGTVDTPATDGYTRGEQAPATAVTKGHAPAMASSTEWKAAWLERRSFTDRAVPTDLRAAARAWRDHVRIAVRLALQDMR